jgi:hypothetical protein
MKKGSLLKITNGILAFDFLIIAATAILHELIIPTGYYGVVHALPGFLFIFLVIVHVTLNRKWIVSNYFKKNKER